MVPFVHPLPLLLVAMAATASLASAQTAEKPAINVGDHWTYQQVDKDGREVTWGRKVLSVDADGGFTVQTAPDKTMRFDGSWNYVDPRGSEYGRAAIRFPMTIGDEWSFVARQLLQTNRIDQRNKYRIVAQESITVPAGTFDRLRAEGTSEATYKNAYTRQMKVTYWYCPQVKAVAKFVRDTTTSTREAGASRESVESVLIRYAPGR